MNGGLKQSDARTWVVVSVRMRRMVVVVEEKEEEEEVRDIIIIFFFFFSRVRRFILGVGLIVWM